MMEPPPRTLVPARSTSAGNLANTEGGKPLVVGVKGWRPQNHCQQKQELLPLATSSSSEIGSIVNFLICWTCSNVSSAPHCFWFLLLLQTISVFLNGDPDNFISAALGVRNSVGMDFNPVTGNLWFTENGRDNIGNSPNSPYATQNCPDDELNVLEEFGQDFGYPYSIFHMYMYA